MEPYLGGSGAGGQARAPAQVAGEALCRAGEWGPASTPTWEQGDLQQSGVGRGWRGRQRSQHGLRRAPLRQARQVLVDLLQAAAQDGPAAQRGRRGHGGQLNLPESIRVHYQVSFPFRVVYVVSDGNE